MIFITGLIISRVCHFCKRRRRNKYERRIQGRRADLRHRRGASRRYEILPRGYTALRRGRLGEILRRRDGLRGLRPGARVGDEAPRQLQRRLRPRVDAALHGRGERRKAAFARAAVAGAAYGGARGLPRAARRMGARQVRRPRAAEREPRDVRGALRRPGARPLQA